MHGARLRLRFALCFGLVLLAACSGREPDTRREVRLALAGEPPTLDPGLATDNVSHSVLINLFEGLTEFDADLRPIPAAAESWEVLDGGRVYLFHLKPGLRWSDGRPLSAVDFEYAWKRLLDPITASEYAYFLFDVENAAEYNRGEIKSPSAVGVRALSDLDLEVRLVRPTAYFPSLTTFVVTFPVRRDVIEDHGKLWTEPENMITNGPYVLETWDHEYRVVLGLNPNYAGRRPFVERVTFYMVEVEATALSLYETNDLEMVKLPPEAISAYRDSEEFVRYPFLRGTYYGFNVKKAPFNDVRVRRAFALAIDKSKLPEILQGGELPANSWVPKGMLAYNPGVGLAFDPARARALLAAAGYPEGRGFPEVTAVFNTTPENLLVAQYLQSQWKKNLGIEIGLDNMEWKFYLSRLSTDPPPIFRLGWGADFPDPDNFMSLFAGWSGVNQTGWSNAGYDEIIRRAAQETATVTRIELYDRAQRILCEEEVPIIPLYTSTVNMLVKRYLRGFVPNAMDIRYMKGLYYRHTRAGLPPLFRWAGLPNPGEAVR
ncbi:MAG: peptide ABC transporter substrate-binding protein [Nitrospirae bacterium]|nr:peptide ABC transporter substrate-binding protein [Nitrospirota bacterium]